MRLSGNGVYAAQQPADRLRKLEGRWLKHGTLRGVDFAMPLTSDPGNFTHVTTRLQETATLGLLLCRLACASFGVTQQKDTETCRY